MDKHKQIMKLRNGFKQKSGKSIDEKPIWYAKYLEQVLVNMKEEIINIRNEVCEK